MEELKKWLSKTNSEDLKEAQDRDFESWNYELSYDI